MNTIKKQHLKKFAKDTEKLFHNRVYAILWIGIILIPLFAILDFVVVREHFQLFLIYRVLCSLCFIILLLLNHHKLGRGHPFEIAITGFILAGLTISMMILKTGGYSSFYYAGIVLVLVTYSTILPLSASQARMSGMILFIVFTMPILLAGTPVFDTLIIFFSNCFFFLSFWVISIVQCHEETKARIREFNLRMELDSHAEKLSFYANHLEDEVDKRAKELEKSEIRYRELYENIVDIVILVDDNDKIIIANPLFYTTLKISGSNMQNLMFKQWINPNDVLLVEKRMLAKLADVDTVRNFQFRLVTTQGKILDVECNAKSIKKENNRSEFQMVIRDITDRKRLEKDLINSIKDVQHARSGTILGLAKLAEYRDEDTGSHLERIREYSRVIAVELSRQTEYKDYITKRYIDDIYLSAILHDIGKVGIPDAILLKKGKLTYEEFEIMKQHTIYGGDAISAIEKHVGGQSFLALGKEIAYYHHEKWDGSGYPMGLQGEAIPLSTRIVALADVYDALTSKRSYKDAFSHEKAAEIIVNTKGTHFAPEVVDAFLSVEPIFKMIREKHGCPRF